MAVAMEPIKSFTPLLDSFPARIIRRPDLLDIPDWSIDVRCKQIMSIRYCKNKNITQQRLLTRRALLIIVAYLDLDICITRPQTLIKFYDPFFQWQVGIHFSTYCWPKVMIHISIILRGFFERCIKYFKIVYRHRLLSILEMPATTSLLVSVICCVCLYVETRIPDQIQSLAIQIENYRIHCSV